MKKCCEIIEKTSMDSCVTFYCFLLGKMHHGRGKIKKNDWKHSDLSSGL